MADKSKKSKKELEFEQQISELTNDLQRTRADFENYMKRCEAEKESSREAGRAGAILKLLPIIDDIERSITHMPEDLTDNPWAQGVNNLIKNLNKSLEAMGVKRIESQPGTPFNPDFHDAIQFDEEAEGEHEVIAEEMRSGYTLDGVPIRHSMVKVTRQ